MFRRAPRVPDPPQGTTEQGGEAGSPVGGDHLMVPEVHLRSRSASELMDSTQELRKRSSGGLSGGSHGGSAGVLSGGLSLSHDSIFTSDSRAGSSSPRGGSAMDIPETYGLHHNGAVSPPIGVHPNGPIASHAGVRAELFEAVRRRRGRSRSEDEEEDLGLPSSPYGVSPNTADDHNNMGAHSTCSDGSLLSMGSNEMDEDFHNTGGSVQLFAADRSHSEGLADMALENGDKIPPLSHIAAKHKIAVRPKRTHGPPRLRRLQTTQSVLPSTPEAVEEIGPIVDFKKDDVCLPASPHSHEISQAEYSASSPVERSAPSFEAILERQLKSASLPPGLALAAAANAPAAEVKLARSHSSTEQPNPALIKPTYRRAVSAVRIEQAALASAAASKFSAMFGEENKQEEEEEETATEIEPEKAEVPIAEKRAKPDKLEIEVDRPVPLPRLSPVKKAEEATSPVKEIKSILKKDEKPESPTRKEARSPPILAPKPEPRRISSASSRQRVEPVLVQQRVDFPPPSPVSPAHFVLASYTDDSLEANKDFGAQSPSSLDSLEDFRKMRSPSQSQMDSLERNLKISSDSLSSGTELSSTSDDVRPTPKFRQSWLPTSDSSEDKIEVRPVKLRAAKSRHSDPPVTAAQTELLIRKSSSVDNILSTSIPERKVLSNDSASSSEEVNLRPSEIRRRLKDNEWPARTEKVVKPSTPEFLRLQLNPLDSKQDACVVKTEPARRSSSSSAEELDKSKRVFPSPTAVEVKSIVESKPVELGRKSPEVKDKSSTHEFLRLQLNPVGIKQEAASAKVEPIRRSSSSSTEELDNDNKPKLLKQSLSSSRLRVFSNPPSMETHSVERGIFEAKPIEHKEKAEELPKIISPARLNRNVFKTKNVEVEVVAKNNNHKEETSPIQILPSKINIVEGLKSQTAHAKPVEETPKTEMSPQIKPIQNLARTEQVILRKKPATSETDAECELFKVFARRSLKLTKDSDNNNLSVQLSRETSVQISRDSDKENDEEVKPAASEKTLNSINNNTTPSSVANNNSLNRRPHTVMNSVEPKVERQAQEKTPRPKSYSEKNWWTIKDKDVELVKNESNSGTASLPPNVSSGKATTITPKVKKKLEQWEKLAQQ
ncbi:titin isoform X2 [Cloeon dipterum]